MRAKAVSFYELLFKTACSSSPYDQLQRCYQWAESLLLQTNCSSAFELNVVVDSIHDV